MIIHLQPNLQQNTKPFKKQLIKQKTNICDPKLNTIKSEIYPFVKTYNYDKNGISDTVLFDDIVTNPLNEIFDKIYVVNLEKREDRKEEMLVKLKKHNIKFSFVKAINGFDKPYIDEYNEYKNKPIDDKSHPLEIKYNKKMLISPGALGYIYSWINILNDAIEKKYDNILCFDDDILFHKNFEMELSKVKNIFNGKWKVILLGASQHIWNNINITEKNYYQPVETDGSFAIGIHRSIFKELLTLANKKNIVFDSGPLREVYNKYRTECFVIYPNIVIADVSDSDIFLPRSQSSIAKKLKWDMNNFINITKKNRVSVIMAVYNAYNTIDKAIESILNQTYDDIELIIVNDASTDRTEEKILQFTDIYKNIIYIKNDINIGCYASRNIGIRASSGYYLAFQDADDVSLNIRIEEQIKIITSGQALLCTCLCIRSHLTKIDKLDSKSLMNDVFDKRIHRNRRGDFMFCCKERMAMITMVFPKYILYKIGLFWEERHGADAEFLERFLYSQMNLLLTGRKDIYTFATTTPSIDKIYYRINQTYYVSHEMNDNNITKIYSNRQNEFQLFRERWRKKLNGEQVDYNYPTF